MQRAADSDEQVPVLIVGRRRGPDRVDAARALGGGSPAGQRPHTSDLPKAHVLNQRALEVLDELGVAEAVAQRSTPPANMAATAYYARLAGLGGEYGRRLARLEAWALVGKTKAGVRRARGSR